MYRKISAVMKLTILSVKVESDNQTANVTESCESVAICARTSMYILIIMSAKNAGIY